MKDSVIKRLTYLDSLRGEDTWQRETTENHKCRCHCSSQYSTNALTEYASEEYVSQKHIRLMLRHILMAKQSCAKDKKI